MAKQACEHSYRKAGEIIIRCRKQTGEHDFCCYQYHCPESGQYENAAPWTGCSLRRRETKNK